MRLTAAVALIPFLAVPTWAQDAADALDAPLEVTQEAPLDVPAEALEVEPSDPLAPPVEEPAVSEPLTVETPHGMYEELGASGDWTAIRFQPEPERTVCAIYSRPTESTITEDGNPIPALRGERAAFITWEDGVVSEDSGVFSAMIGAPLAAPFEGHSFATEDGTFALFGHDDRLYAEAASDKEAIAAIRKGLTLTLTAALPAGRTAQDVYSLKGVVAATKIAGEGCAPQE